jgi:inositol transport system permease protein
MSTSAEATATEIEPRRRRSVPPEFNVFIGLIVVAIIFEILGWVVRGESFILNPQRISINILQVSVVGIISVGVTQVIITGGIDLSSGSVLAMTAFVAMSFAQVSTNARAVYPSLTDLPVILPVLIGLFVGGLAGLINGSLIAYTKIPSFIATLGMMVTARGIANWYTRGQPVSFPTESYTIFGRGMMPVIIFIIVAIVFQVLLKYTVYGRRTYAIGSNEQAARVSGINVEHHLILVYTIAGLLAGLAGIVLSARGQTAQGGMGLQYELQAIAMTVIGGTSLTGGRGSIVGTTLGMIIFGVIISGFTYIKVSAYYQEIIMGIIIVAAVVLDVYRQRARGRL